VAIGGGAEASMHPVAMAAFANMTALSTSGHSRPFDARRDGFVMTEGAAALVLEDWDRAVARGATIYAELAGAASTADAHHITAPAPDGAGAVACMELALADAGISPSDVGHINAHGTSTPLNDLAESRAITKVFGEPGPLVTSTKGVTGPRPGRGRRHRGRGRGPHHPPRLIPPTAGYEEPDPEITLHVVHGEPRPWEPSAVLSNSFGFGGHNGCLVKLFDDRPRHPPRLDRQGRGAVVNGKVPSCPCQRTIHTSAARLADHRTTEEVDAGRSAHGRSRTNHHAANGCIELTGGIARPGVLLVLRGQRRLSFIAHGLRELKRRGRHVVGGVKVLERLDFGHHDVVSPLPGRRSN
jgi:acyl transferase domain-containing protein